MHSRVYTIHIFGTTVCTVSTVRGMNQSNRESSIKPSRNSDERNIIRCLVHLELLRRVKKKNCEE